MRYTKRKNRKKDNKGITLIALIVTIIVILILAGASIAMMTGDNGVLTKAAQAKTDTDKASDEEAVKLAVISSIGTEGEVEIAKLQKEMQAIGGTVTPTDGTFPVTVTKGRYKMEVTQTGNLEKPAQNIAEIAGTKLEETTKVRDINGDVAYVPGEYTISNLPTEKEIKRGLVIKDDEQNEWVCVPVSKSELTTNMMDSGSATLCGTTTTTNKYSKLWNFTSTNRTLYPVLGTPGQSSKYREPDVVIGNDGNSLDAVNYNTILRTDTKNLTVDIIQEKSLNMLAQQLVNDYNNMIKSIENYGGFYIGRYELSGNATSPKVVRYGASGDINWYNSYVACSKFTNKDAIGTMIWGTQWDATLEWLAQSYTKDNTTGKLYRDIASSARWGNYSDSDNFTYYTSITDTTGTTKSGSKKIPTGSTEYTKANNIYDLAGNCYEWTQEAYDTYGRVLRRRRLPQ